MSTMNKYLVLILVVLNANGYKGSRTNQSQNALQALSSISTETERHPAAAQATDAQSVPPDSIHLPPISYFESEYVLPNILAIDNVVKQEPDLKKLIKSFNQIDYETYKAIDSFFKTMKEKLIKYNRNLILSHLTKGDMLMRFFEYAHRPSEMAIRTTNANRWIIEGMLITLSEFMEEVADVSEFADLITSETRHSTDSESNNRQCSISNQCASKQERDDSSPSNNAHSRFVSFLQSQKPSHDSPNNFAYGNSYLKDLFTSLDEIDQEVYIEIDSFLKMIIPKLQRYRDNILREHLTKSDIVMSFFKKVDHPQVVDHWIINIIRVVMPTFMQKMAKVVKHRPEIRNEKDVSSPSRWFNFFPWNKMY